jgi:shikimate dehydrogenase
MRRFGLIGYPLTHSFSKKYFEEKFHRQEISNCFYELYPLPAIGNLKKLVADLPELEGLNVTIPYKQLVIPHLHEFKSAGLNACNCIRIRNGKLTGYNTDIIGFERSLLPLLKMHHTNALVLGNGGAAKAVCFVLNKLGISYQVVSRKLHDGAALTYKDLDESLVRNHLLIINTTPVGTFPGIEDFPAIPYQYITEEHLLYDLIYNPSKTRFLEFGEQKGATVVNGFEMLKIQAEESWKIWNDSAG